MSVTENPTSEVPPEPAAPGDRAAPRDRWWTIGRGMVAIALLAPVLALARFPFAFGLVATLGLVALFVLVVLRTRRYGWLAAFVCLYPAFPLAAFHLEWFLTTRRYARRSELGLLDGAIGLSDIGALACLIAYVGCVGLAFGRRKPSQDDPARRRAARWVVVGLPLGWTGLAAFALWDPLGVMARLFR